MSENKMSPEELTNLEKDFPSVELAYPIAVSSYDFMAKRFDSLDAKMQNMTVVSLTMFLVIPTIGNARSMPFSSVLFWLSIFCLLLSVCISVYARTNSKVRFLDPQVIYDSYIETDPREFKYTFVCYAAEDAKIMNDRIERNWNFNLYSMISFIFALALAVFWLLAGNRP